MDSLAGEMKRVSGKYVATFARILHVLLSRGGVSVFGHALDPRRHNDGLSETGNAGWKSPGTNYRRVGYVARRRFVRLATSQSVLRTLAAGKSVLGMNVT